MTRRAARFTQAEVSRAIRAAAAVGPHMAVEILPDGIIRIAPASHRAPESEQPDQEKVIPL